MALVALALGSDAFGFPVAMALQLDPRQPLAIITALLRQSAAVTATAANHGAV